MIEPTVSPVPMQPRSAHVHPDAAARTRLQSDPRGVWFGVDHACPDGATPVYPEFQWERGADGEQVSPRRWLVCDRCGWAVSIVTRDPDGRVRP